MKDEILIINADEKEFPSGEMSYEAMKFLSYQQQTGMKTVVMVLAYGKVGKTEACVKNILKYTDDTPYELWLIDNGSVENEILGFYKSVDYAAKKIIRITKNISAVFAMNAMMHAVTSEYFVFVNNDVIVTKNWLKNLLICAESNPKIGAVCPVSTNISNRQEETLGGFADLEEMQEKAAVFNQSDKNKWEERLRIVPTATLYRREAVDEVGVFDIGFQHDFGDDDYFFRMRRAGYQLIVSRDTFVHHNHEMKERDLSGMESRRFQRGKESFRRKYHGLDAWEDGANHIVEFSHYGDLGTDRERQVQILGVDTRCGTPILDVKNKFKANGCHNFDIDAFTTDVKYYMDLSSISDSVTHDNIAYILSAYRDKKYQFVVLGEAVNSYRKPEEVILDLLSLTEAGGVLLFPVYNMDNIYEFLWEQGAMEERAAGTCQWMPYEEVINILRSIPIKKLDINFEPFPITEQIRVFAEQRAYPGVKNGREERIQNLFVRAYWFWVQKA